MVAYVVLFRLNSTLVFLFAHVLTYGLRKIRSDIIRLSLVWPSFRSSSRIRSFDKTNRLYPAPSRARIPLQQK